MTDPLTGSLAERAQRLSASRSFAGTPANASGAVIQRCSTPFGITEFRGDPNAAGPISAR